MKLSSWGNIRGVSSLLAAFCIPILLAPPLFLAFGVQKMSAVVITLLAAQAFLRLGRQLADQLSFSCAAAISILAISIFGPEPTGYAGPWVFAIPAALLWLRPAWGVLLAVSLILLANLVNVSLTESFLWLLFSVCVTGPVYWATHLLVESLASPIESELVVIRRLLFIFSIYYSASTLWFALVYHGIQIGEPGSFTSTSGLEPKSLDFLLFSAMLNSSGEPVYLSPISQLSRIAVTAEMITSYLFTAIYFAIAVTNLMDKRKTYRHSSAKGASHAD